MPPDFILFLMIKQYYMDGNVYLIGKYKSHY